MGMHGSSFIMPRPVGWHRPTRPSSVRDFVSISATAGPILTILTPFNTHMMRHFSKVISFRIVIMILCSDAVFEKKDTCFTTSVVILFKATRSIQIPIPPRKSGRMGRPIEEIKNEVSIKVINCLYININVMFAIGNLWMLLLFYSECEHTGDELNMLKSTERYAAQTTTADDRLEAVCNMPEENERKTYCSYKCRSVRTYIHVLNCVQYSYIHRYVLYQIK